MIKLVKSTFWRENETKRALCSFIMRSRKLSFGSQCRSFEENFARWQGRRDAVLVSSGSMANLALLRALVNLGRLRSGDLIGFSAVTWSTNVMPIIESGLRPVPVDIDSATLNVSSQTLGKILSKYNLKALILTNLLGFCSDIDNISNLCRQQKVILLEDNCEALGSVYGRKKLGNFGLASTFSFYVGHHLSAIEGGAIVTDDAQLATMLRVVRAHGWDRELSDTAKRDIRKHYGVKSGFDAQYTFYDLGYNMRPTEITGFLGNVQLKSIEVILRKRRENFAYLAERIYGRTDLYNPVRTDHIDSVPAFAFPVICRNIKIRDLLTGRCRGKVEIRPIMGGNIADQPFFRKYVKEFQYDCPNAEWARNHGLYFGINPEMTRNELDRIISVFTGI